MLPFIILGILLAIVIIVLISNIVIVPQARAAVIERLGTYTIQHGIRASISAFLSLRE